MTDQYPYDRKAPYGQSYQETHTSLNPEVFCYVQCKEPGRPWDVLGGTMVTAEGLEALRARVRKWNHNPIGWRFRIIRTTVEVVPDPEQHTQREIDAGLLDESVSLEDYLTNLGIRHGDLHAAR